MNEEETDHYTNLIEEAKLEEVLGILKQKYPKDKTIIQFFSRLNYLKKQNINGIISDNNAETKRNKISKDLLIFINEYDIIKIVDSTISDSSKKSKKQHIFNGFLPTIFHTLKSFFSIIASLFTIIAFPVLLFGLVYILSINLPKLKDSVLSEANNDESINLPKIIAASPFFEERKIKGADKKGKIAEYIVFLVRNFNWRIGEIALSEKNGKLNDICSQLKEIGVASRVNRDDLKGIVCFGNTSYEESSTIPEKERLKLEEERADKRAQKLAECVSNVLIQSTPIFTSNIGKYKIDDEISAYQRSIILIGIIKNEMNVVNEEALLNAFQKEFISGNWELNLNLFSKVENDRIEIHKYFN